MGHPCPLGAELERHWLLNSCADCTDPFKTTVDLVRMAPHSLLNLIVLCAVTLYFLGV